MLKKIAAKIGYGLLILMVTAELLVLSLRWIDPPMWSWRLHRSLYPPSSYPEDVAHQWRNLNAISPSMVLAVVAAEDQRFPQHWGVDYSAIMMAFKNNQQGGKLRGASTITQQTAKNLWLWPAQSYWRKAFEAGFSLLLELSLPKQRILEIYLNVAEFGPGIYGVEAASKHYFKLPAARLSHYQSASLAALLPSPYRYSLWPKTPYMQKRVTWIQQQMRQLGGAYLNFTK
ncbi:monofunctional biosynthetic peptidoglycan transglycosylase [Agarivorans sp. Toyoura001]|uniref:monofunctional biosynthetic peptidoglycan transglycosylase n=1 Tax=Agarivorans sp. Toyoura001 TaxID=2283141 RepID=UPI0010F12E0C|nr:monofunctional biosynthetic peptidoglycan transglycosylase [Agarivorans sp. Toyoura001]GDY24661.1 monofunctional biosynthetic peptidoglycan transglycosylase [Agarivorans sp. Toyoura001]